MGSTVTMDGEELLARIQQIEYILDEIRSAAADGVFVAPDTTGIDITQIEWLKKGSEPASPGDPWAWAFGYNEDGNYLPESETLVRAIEQSGKVEIDGYEMILSGRDNNLLNRKKIRPKGRGR